VQPCCSMANLLRFRHKQSFKIRYRLLLWARAEPLTPRVVRSLLTSIRSLVSVTSERILWHNG